MPEVIRGTTPLPDRAIITNTYKRPIDDAVLVYAKGVWYEQFVVSNTILLSPTENPYTRKS